MLSDNREKLVIDVRDKSDYEKSSHPDAINIPWEKFLDNEDVLPKDKPIYLFCYSGKHSVEICEELVPQGYEIYSIESGIYSYYRYTIENQLSDKEEKENRCKDIERSIIKKFRPQLWSQFTKAINTYELIKDGDKIAVEGIQTLRDGAMINPITSAEKEEIYQQNLKDQKEGNMQSAMQ